MATQDNTIDLRTLGYVSETEAAALYGVTVGTLRNWRVRNVGPPYTRVQRNRIAYQVAAIKKHLEGRTVKTVKVA